MKDKTFAELMDDYVDGTVLDIGDWDIGDIVRLQEVCDEEIQQRAHAMMLEQLRDTYGEDTEYEETDEESDNEEYWNSDWDEDSPPPAA